MILEYDNCMKYKQQEIETVAKNHLRMVRAVLNIDGSDILSLCKFSLLENTLTRFSRVNVDSFYRATARTMVVCNAKEIA